jgi:hypothetical protein
VALIIPLFGRMILPPLGQEASLGRWAVEMMALDVDLG